MIAAAPTTAAAREREHPHNGNSQYRKKLNPLSHQKSPIGVIL
jgi:hypothetical protein